MPFKLTTAERERFEAKVFRVPGGCWIWTGARHRKGYGQFTATGKTLKAHRVAWVLAGREIPPGALVLHNCPGGDDASCVNPEHLWLGDHLKNQRDKAIKGRGTRNGSCLPFGAHLSRSGRFLSSVCVNRRKLYLGTYDTAEEASAVAVAERAKHR